MTSREIIQRHLSFDDPPRIGLAFGDGRLTDVVMAGPSSEGFWQPKRWSDGRFEYYDDEWGNTWFRVAGMSRGGEIFRPAIADWSRLDEYRLPDLAHPRRFEGAKATFSRVLDQYRLGMLPGFPFAICRYLRKIEVYLQDLLLERDRVDELHRRVADLLERMMEQYARVGADGVFFCEDWGLQDRLLIHPGLWREIFRPLFDRLCGKARDLGLTVFMHSCGYIWEILDDLAGAGIRVFQFDQTVLYGLERLSEKLQAHRVCLYAPVDIQQVLSTGDRQRIEAYARALCRLFGRPRGGFIACSYGDLAGIGVAPEWDRWAYETFLQEAGLADLRPVTFA